MQKSNVEILHHFYGLLMEMNFHEPDEVLSEAGFSKEDPFIQKHLRLIKLQSSKYKALMRKTIFQKLLDEFQRLNDIGFDRVKEYLNPQEAAQLQPLFSKFAELTAKDKESIAEDKELLKLLSSLKDRLDNEQSNE